MALVRTSLGNMIDMEALATKNKESVAVSGGGISMNANGDYLGKGGKVIRKREDLEKAYAAYAEANPEGTKQVDIRSKNITPDVHPLHRQENVAPVEPVVLDLEDVSALLAGKDPKPSADKDTAEETEEPIVADKEKKRKRKTVEDE